MQNPMNPESGQIRSQFGASRQMFIAFGGKSACCGIRSTPGHENPFGHLEEDPPMPIYMKIEGVKGRVTAQGYDGWIELESAHLGFAGNEIIMARHQDDVSMQLMRLANRGAAVNDGKKVTIAFCKTKNAGCVPYLKVELENALISSYSISGHGGDAGSRPMESMSLNFTKVLYKTGSQALLQNEGAFAGATR
jgi:type VI secretion system secreted protein Hcp